MMALTSVFVSFVVCQCLCHFLGVRGLRLDSIRPARVRVSKNPENITVICLASEAISDCQFNWRKEDSYTRVNGHVMDVSQGDTVQQGVPRQFSDKVLWYHYSGKGLAAGECGITLHIKGEKKYTLGCRFRSQTSGWIYGYVPLQATNYDVVDMNFSPEQVVAVGDDAKFSCGAAAPITECEFRVPGFQKLSFTQGSEKRVSLTHPGLSFSGKGLANRECGVRVEKVSEKMNGYVSCTLETENTNADSGWGTIPFIVTSPPDAVKLNVSEEEGGSVLAECTTGLARPPAKIQWLWGGKPIQGSKDNGERNDTWRWYFDLRATSQTLTLDRTERWESNELSCTTTNKADKQRIKPFASSKCPPVAHSTLVSECAINGITVNCSNSMDVGTLIQVYCKVDYDNDPDQSISTCREGGVWDQKPIQHCKRKDANCPTLSDSNLDTVCMLGDSIVSCDEIVAIGTQVIVSCRKGFIPPHKEKLLCTASGSWNQTIQTCKSDIPCPNINGEGMKVKCIINGAYKKCDFSSRVGTVAILSCLPGFKASKGLNQTKCLSGGSWDSGSLLTCEAATGCFPLDTPNRIVTCSKDQENVDCSQMVSPGTIASLTCQSPGAPQTSQVPVKARCSKSGQWDNLDQNCGIDKRCPPMEVANAEVTCSLAGSTVSCSDFVKPGTEVNISCADGFVVRREHFEGRQRSDAASITTRCQDTGTWNNSHLFCGPDCGRRNNLSELTNEALSGGFQKAYRGEFPWHVGLYLLSKDKSIAHHCGATLIHESFVLTAAHCVSDQNQVMKANVLKVVAGTTNLPWNNEEERDTMQKRDVVTVTIHERYSNVVVSSDIAILKLSAPMKITPYVNIACIDWQNDFRFNECDDSKEWIGLVAGWGTNQTHAIRSPFLRFLDMPFVTYKTCKEALRNQENFLTSDKICAGYRHQGKSLCPGDSGGGLVIRVEKSLRYHLAGISSTQFPQQRTINDNCEVSQYNAFTALVNFVPWIRQEIVSNDDRIIE